MSTPADAHTKTKWSPPLANLRNTLALPPKWLAMYDDFVTKNASQVSQLESALRSLTYIIPGRFRDAELATESIHSSVQLLSLYHDLLLFRSSLSPSSSSSSAKFPTALSKSLHARYTRFWAAKSALYRRVAIVLQMVQYTELLLEMWAKRRGEAMRWRVVVLIEAAKAFCRLLLLRITRSRPLVTPVLPERETVPEPGDQEEDADDGKALAELMGEEDSSSEHADENGHANGDAALVKHDGTNGNGTALHANGNGKINGNGALHRPNGHAASSTKTMPPPNPQKEWAMPRTGLTLPSLPAKGDISSYLLSRVLTADDIKPATKLLHSLAGSAHTAEVLHILAPLVYALALARTDPARRRTSWAPWLVGLSVQVAARQLAARARDGGGVAAAPGGTALEREEWARRGRAMWWWLMRGAAYENVVKGVVGGVRRRVPGFVGTILEDYEYLWENYYFSTSDS
ncbi:peroxisomal membrane protein PEX16 [Diaporthe helianthi]|uniref:Peroxisomal membrane protein PEX16 n=1 Tax=Diaporthe helianthi TaxID=158607 RepID=A0A2P5I086_DIAHE|nr:peroxisomal membrane protein PEX16 [Diaporthe helianthi]